MLIVINYLTFKVLVLLSQIFDLGHLKVGWQHRFLNSLLLLLKVSVNKWHWVTWLQSEQLSHELHHHLFIKFNSQVSLHLALTLIYLFFNFFI